MVCAVLISVIFCSSVADRWPGSNWRFWFIIIIIIIIIAVVVIITVKQGTNSERKEQKR
jgi:sugar phosphate permease